MRIDFELSGHGTVYPVRPITRAAHHWVAEHLPTDATWWCGPRSSSSTASSATSWPARLATDCSSGEPSTARAPSREAEPTSEEGSEKSVGLHRRPRRAPTCGHHPHGRRGQGLLDAWASSPASVYFTNFQSTNFQSQLNWPASPRC